MNKLICLILLFSWQVLTAQNADNMYLLGHWDNDTLPLTLGGKTFNDCWGYAANGREYAILGSASMVHFFDVTDPANIVLVDEFEGGNITTWRDMKTYRGYAYSVADNTYEGLMVYDLHDLPNSVTKVNQTTANFERAHNIFIDKGPGRLYVVGSSVNVRVFDVASNPEDPILLSNTALPGGYVHDIYVKDNIAYASHLSNGLYIYDISDPANPIVLGTLTEYPGEVFNHSSWVSNDGEKIIFCDEKRFTTVKVIDSSDLTDLFVEPENEFIINTLPQDTFGSVAHNPFLVGDLAFVSYYHEGVQVFDISDVNNVERVAFYDTFENDTYSGFDGCWGVYPYLPSGNIIASDRDNGLFVLAMNGFTTGINDAIEKEELPFHLSPNPSEDFVNILLNDWPDDGVFIQIYDTQGRLLQRNNVEAKLSIQLNLQNFPKGVYWIEVNGVGQQLIRQ